jgi:aspartate kinase
MPTNPVTVQKYRGACLATADLAVGHRVVAIVSAIGETTDELVRMAYQAARILIAANSTGC